MPLLSITTNQLIATANQQAILEACSQQIAAALGKPERYVMVKLETNQAMSFAGNTAPCAYLELKSLGLPEATTVELSTTLCNLIEEQFSIPSDRIYIEFSSPERHMWGWDNSTF